MRDLEGSYLCFTDQGMAALVWLRAAMLSSVPGVDSPPHLPLYPPPLLESKEKDRASPPVYDWKVDPHPQFKFDIYVKYHFEPKEIHRDVWASSGGQILKKSINP